MMNLVCEKNDIKCMFFWLHVQDLVVVVVVAVAVVVVVVGGGASCC